MTDSASGPLEDSLSKLDPLSISDLFVGVVRIALDNGIGRPQDCLGNPLKKRETFMSTFDWIMPPLKDVVKDFIF